MMLYTCNDCGTEKPFAEMQKDSRIQNGVTGECLDCRSKRRYADGSYDRERIRKHEVKSGKPSYYTDEVIQRLMSATSCTYCGCEVNRIPNDRHQVTMDHVYAIRGYAGVNIDNNIVAACRVCNSSKQKLHIYDFYQANESFTYERWRKFVEDFGSRLLKRKLTQAEVYAFEIGFKEEAAELVASEVKV